jgi:hypothetical protein
MELLDLQERWVPWVNLVGPASRELLEPRETLARRDLKEALAYKDPEESQASPGCPESPD